MKYSFIIICNAFVLSIGLLSCDTFDKVICGEPEGRKKEFIDSVNKVWMGKLILKQVPCYPSYIQINLKEVVDNRELAIIESSFRETIEWAELLVYDKEGKLIRGNKGSM